MPTTGLATGTAEPQAVSLLGSPPGSLVLRVINTQFAGREFRLAPSKIVIGSASACAVRLPDLDPFHCFLVRGERHVAARLWSTSGWLNGYPFRDSPLDVGDRLSLGPYELEVVTLGAEYSPDQRIECLLAQLERLQSAALGEGNQWQPVDPSRDDWEREQQALRAELDRLTIARDQLRERCVELESLLRDAHEAILRQDPQRESSRGLDETVVEQTVVEQTMVEQTMVEQTMVEQTMVEQTDRDLVQESPQIDPVEPPQAVAHSDAARITERDTREVEFADGEDDADVLARLRRVGVWRNEVTSWRDFELEGEKHSKSLDDESSSRAETLAGDEPYSGPSLSPRASAKGALSSSLKESKRDLDHGRGEDDSEDLIQSYMDRLLKRVQGQREEVQASMSGARKTDSSNEGAKSPAPNVAPSTSAVEVTKPGLGEFVRPEDYRPRSTAPEVDLKAMREVANNSARSALKTYERKRGKESARSMMTYAAVSFFGGLFSLLVVREFSVEAGWIGAGIGFGVAAFLSLVSLVNATRFKHPVAHD